jgi:hypothetical protein
MSTRYRSNDGNAAFITAITTEYWALQAARSGTVFESAGRLTGYLATLSSFVVALAFIGQVSKLGRPFYLFASLLLPILFYVGVITYGRVLQNGLEDLLVTRGMARMRRALVELAPEARPYFVLSLNDDVAGHMRSMAVDPSGRQLMFTSASFVAVLNSVVAGVFLGLICTGLLALPIEAGAGMGGVSGLSTFLLFMRHESGHWRRGEAMLTPMFPSGATGEPEEARQRRG